mgnify:CR=1 FL=1
MLDRATVSDVELPKKEYTVERARVPLVLKLFGLTAVLIVIVVGLAVGITIQRANEVANETVSASINGAAKLFRELEDQRLARLRLPTELLGSDRHEHCPIPRRKTERQTVGIKDPLRGVFIQKIGGYKNSRQ